MYLVIFQNKNYYIMPFKCCVTGCRGNYDKEHKVKLFRLPNKNRNPQERERWIRSIPRENIPNSPNTFICENHWPVNYETCQIHGKIRPLNPPTIFICVFQSQIPTPPPTKRTTTKSLPSTRNMKPDEISAHLDLYEISCFDDLCLKVSKEVIPFPVTSFTVDDGLIIQSKDYIDTSAIPQFLLKVKIDMRFEGFHFGSRCSIIPLCSNRIHKITSFLQILEAIRYLHSVEMDHKKNIILQQVVSMHALTFVGNKKYSPEILSRAFEYFSISRSLYSRIRDDYEMPSIVTLGKLISKVSKLEDFDFLNKYFMQLEDPRQKNVIIIIDEVYVKPQLTYQGGNLFGKAVNNPEHFATTVLSFMICSLLGGKRFLYKALPVYRLSADFQYEQVVNMLNLIRSCNGITVAILCDNNKVNQSFFKKFNLISPWRTTENIFLLYDYVHLIKSIRNNWLTEKMQELKYSDCGLEKTAKWVDLKKLVELENNSIVKLSKLNEISICPKPIERQNVALCLKIFCVETLTALKIHPEIQDSGGTVDFIEKIVDFFKILNVKSQFEDVKTKDLKRAVFDNPNDQRLDFLLDIASMFEKMVPKKQGQRVKQLTKDTALALAYTSRGLVELTKHLLSTSHEYVCLGNFSSDPIEKMFSKLRQGSGGTYFINF